MLVPLLSPAGKPLYKVVSDAPPYTVKHSRRESNTTGAPNPAPGDLWLPILKEDTEPVYDPVFSVLTTVEGFNAEMTEVHITYAVTDKPQAEVVGTVENLERMAFFNKHVALHDHVRDITILVDNIAAKLDGATFSDEVIAAKDRNSVVAAKLKANKELASQVKDQIQAGQKPDLNNLPWAAKP